MRKQMFMLQLLFWVALMTMGCSLGREKLGWRVRDMVLRHFGGESSRL